MPAARLLRRIPHTPDDLVSLVSDVARYPDFIDLISNVRVGQTKTFSPDHTQFEADAVISYKFLNETFRSRVNVHPQSRRIMVEKPDKSGAVKSLSNSWIFHELSDGSTLVEFYVDVRLKAFPLEMLIRDKFDKASTYIMKRFEQRADVLFTRLPETPLDMTAETARLGLRQVSV